MKISYFRETKSKILSVQCSKVKTGPWEKRNCERKNFGNLTRRKNKRMVNKRFLRTQRCINVFHMLYLSIICSTYWESQKLEDFSGNKMDRLTQKISLSSVFPSPRLSKILTFFHFSRRSGFHLLFIFWEPDTPTPKDLHNLLTAKARKPSGKTASGEVWGAGGGVVWGCYWGWSEEWEGCEVVLDQFFFFRGF